MRSHLDEVKTPKPLQKQYYLDKIEAIERLLAEKGVRDASDRGTPGDGRFYHEHTKTSWQADFDNLRLRDRLDVLFATVAPWSEDLKNELALIDEILGQEKLKLEKFASDSDYYLKDLEEAEEVIHESREKSYGQGFDYTAEHLESNKLRLKKELKNIVDAELNTPFNNRPDLKTVNEVKIRASSFLHMVSNIYDVYGYGVEIGNLQFLLSQTLPFSMTEKINIFIQETLELNEKERRENLALKNISREELVQKIVNHFPEILTPLLRWAQENQKSSDWDYDPLKLLLQEVSQYLFQKDSFTAAEADLAPLIAAKNKINDSELEQASKLELIQNLDSIYSGLQARVTEVSEAKQASQLPEAKKVAKLHFNVVSILCEKNGKPEESRKAIIDTYTQSTSFFERLAETFRAFADSVAKALRITVTINNPYAPVDYMSTAESDAGTDTQSEVDESRQEKKYGSPSPRLFHSFTEMKGSIKDTAIELLREPKAS